MKAVVIGAAAHKITVQWLSPGDGVRAAAKLWFEDGAVHAENTKGERRSVQVGRAEFSARMPGLPRRITFADGVVVVVDDNDYIDAALGGRGLLYRMEAHWRGIFSSIAAAVFVGWAFIAYALPLATEIIAARVPQTTLETLSEEAYVQLKESDFLSPSQLPPADMARLEAVFSRTVGEEAGERKGESGGFRYQLRFHKMPFDIANAFAFPDGMVIASDGLIALLTEKEVEAVFAHEISHIRHRHGLRAVMQSSAVFVLSSFLFGDISFVLSSGAAILVQQKFSRDFEREADCDAYFYLRRRGESEQIMVAALTKLESDYEKAHEAAAEGKKEKPDSETVKDEKPDIAAGDKLEKADDAAGGEETKTQKALRAAWELLSTHPATHERVDFRKHCDD
ncbi:MAG: M48 family metallopeptidase [Gammaproteobacteria bacterium]